MLRYFFFVLTFSIVFLSQAQFTLSGEFRPRMEYRHGYRTLAEKDQDPGLAIDQRTRLNLDYNEEKYQIKIVFQDIRTWGSQPQLVSNDGYLTTIHEAWGLLKLNDNSTLKMGRQEIVIDNARLLGNSPWPQPGRTQDGLLFENKKENSTLTIGAAYNQDAAQPNNNFYTVDNSYKTLQFTRYKQSFGSMDVGFLLINNGMQAGTLNNSTTNFSQTFGTRLVWKKDVLQPSGNIYLQRGKDATGTTLIAHQITAEMKFVQSEKTQWTAGIEYWSGNDETISSSQNNAFIALYGNNHKFNGLMDYFYVGNHQNSVGLKDIYVQLDTKLAQWDVLGQLHFFSAAESILDPGTTRAADNYLGTELDLVVSHAHSKDVNLMVGYSQMVATKSMEILKSGNSNATQNWGWIMITFKPTFFTTVGKD